MKINNKTKEEIEEYVKKIQEPKEGCTKKLRFRYAMPNLKFDITKNTQEELEMMAKGFLPISNLEIKE